MLSIIVKWFLSYIHVDVDVDVDIVDDDNDDDDDDDKKIMQWQIVGGTLQ